MIKKKFKKIFVVLGGDSGERIISLKSGKACIKALRKKKYNVSSFDPKNKSLNLINKLKVDAIFNALHGKNGEDGVAQSYFEYLRIPYTHSGIISSYNAMNKIISKEIFIKSRIPTPKYFFIDKNKVKTEHIKKKLKERKINFPVVIKPINEGSSLSKNYKKF